MVSLYDRTQHGQTWTDMSNPEVRDAYIGMLADGLTVGSALKFQGLRPGLVSATDEISTARRWVMIGSQYADTAATVNTGLTAAQQYDQMTPEQRLAVFGQMGFWLSMTALSARRAGGLGNLYGRQDIGDLLRRGRQQGTGAPGANAPETPDLGNPNRLMTQEEISNPTQRYTPEQLQLRTQQLRTQVSTPGRPVNSRLDPNAGGNISILTPPNRTGGVQEITVVYGPNVRAGDLAEHFARVSQYQQYRGVRGSVRAARERVQAWVTRNGKPVPGTVAADAFNDINKLNNLIALRQRALDSGGLNQDDSYALRVEIAGIRQELAVQQRILDRMDRSPGFGGIDSRSQDYSEQNRVQHERALTAFLDKPENQSDPRLQEIMRQIDVKDRNGNRDISASIDKFLENYHLYMEGDKLRIRRTQGNEELPQLELRHHGDTWEFRRSDGSPDIISQKLRRHDGTTPADTPSMTDKDYLRTMQERGDPQIAYTQLERQRTDLINQQNDFKRQNKLKAAENLQGQINAISERIGMQRSQQSILSVHPNAQFIYGKPGQPGRPGDFDLVARIPGKDGQPPRYIVVESKGGNSGLESRMVEVTDRQGNSTELRAEQGSRPYFDKIRELMRNNADPNMRQVARELGGGLDAKTVEYWHVSTPINGGKTGKTNIQYFDMQYPP